MIATVESAKGALIYVEVQCILAIDRVEGVVSYINFSGNMLFCDVNT